MMEIIKDSIVEEILRYGWSSDLVFYPGHEGGIGGQLGESVEDFRVDEVGAYDLDGSGEHVFLRIEKVGKVSVDVCKVLQRVFGVGEKLIGYAGMKDKCARTSQWFSVHVRNMEIEEKLEQLSEYSWMRVLEVTRHHNKLRIGHLRGNYFGAHLYGVGASDEEIEARCELLRREGFVNYFGKQRFGIDGKNIQDGYDILLGRGRYKYHTEKICVSALQSAIFNLICHLRIRDRGLEIYEGDVMEKLGGGCFVCEDVSVDSQRMLGHEIMLTGVLAGEKVMYGRGYGFLLEQACCSSFGVSWPDGSDDEMANFSQMKRFGRGTRRVMVEFVDQLSWRRLGDEEIWVEFFLPSGTYATVFLRELCGKKFNR